MTMGDNEVRVSAGEGIIETAAREVARAMPGRALVLTELPGGAWAAAVADAYGNALTGQGASVRAALLALVHKLGIAFPRDGAT
jgi:hypothetical protein